MVDADSSRTTVDVVVVGAGFGGMFMLHRLRGMGLSARAFERGSGVGGTWYWNRYPGARCDIESMEYSYQFDDDLQQEWSWTERFAPQPEILEYANHVADRYSLRDDIEFDTERAVGDLRRGRRPLDGDGRRSERRARGDRAVRGDGHRMPVVGQHAGVPRPRLVRGRDLPHRPLAAAGRRLHRQARRGDRHRVVGRAVDPDHRRAGRPAHGVPAHRGLRRPGRERTARSGRGAGRSRPATREFREANSQQVPAFGSRTPANEQLAGEATPEERQAEFERRWHQGGLTFLGAFGDLLIDPASNDLAAEFVRSKIREIVDDPAVAELLSPHTLIGAKRLCLGTNYYETYNRPNVELVDVGSTPISAITPTGVQVGDRSYDVDVIVLATGFDAMTGSLLAVDIRGRDGLPLQEAWHAGPRTFLGLEIPGFPNLFTVSGPGSPSVLTNMMVSIEHHVNWIADCIAYLRDNSKQTIEARPESADQWVEYVNAVAAFTVYPVGQLVVPRRQHPRQAPHLHAADRLPALRRAVHRHRREGLRRLRPHLTSDTTPPPNVRRKLAP